MEQIRDRKPKYTVIVLLEEKGENFSEYIKTLQSIFLCRKESFEMLIIANGTEGFLRNELKKLAGCSFKIRSFAFNRKAPQAVCIKSGLRESTGEIIVACGSYQQITRESFDIALDSLDEEADMVIPWRRGRVDPLFNQYQSRVFNNLVRWITRLDLHDLSCNLKIFRRSVVDGMKFYGNMYRFLPVVASLKGSRCREVRCGHFQERGKTGFYSISEYFTRIVDIVSLFFIMRYTRKPLRFFGTLGVMLFLTSIVFISGMFFQRFVFGYPVGGRPLLLIGFLFMALGVQAVSVGLLGEIIAFTHGRRQKEYSIAEYRGNDWGDIYRARGDETVGPSTEHGPGVASKSRLEVEKV